MLFLLKTISWSLRLNALNLFGYVPLYAFYTGIEGFAELISMGNGGLSVNIPLSKWLPSVALLRCDNDNTKLDLGRCSMSQQPNNPLHGLSLEKILTRLVEHYGWNGLDQRIRINCFNSDPSIKSSLKFLRKTQWARDKVEALYIDTFC